MVVFYTVIIGLVVAFLIALGACASIGIASKLLDRCERNELIEPFDCGGDNGNSGRT